MNRLTIPTGKRLLGFTEFTPADIQTYVWHDASDASTITIGTGVSQWDDKSGAGIDVTQTTGSQQPTILSNELNNLDVLTFDASSQQYIGRNGTDRFSSSDLHLIILSKPVIVTNRHSALVSYRGDAPDFQIDPDDSDTQFNGAIDTQGFSADDISYNQTNVTTWNMWGAEFIPENTIASWFNGVLQTIKPTTGTLDLTYIDYRYGTNRGAGAYISCQIAEVLMFPRQYRPLVEGYLAWKWGLQDSLDILHPFKTKAP